MSHQLEQIPDQRPSGAYLRVLGAAAMVVSCMNASAVRAGLYNTAEPRQGPTVSASSVEAMTFSEFRGVLNDDLSIGVTLQESRRRQHYLQKTNELLQKEGKGGLSTEEKVNLSEYLIRLGKIEEAVQLLTPVSVRERDNFMVLANLGTAHQLAGRFDRARTYLEMVKDATWPREWPGFTREELNWYRQVEKYHLKLVRLRDLEARQQASARQRGVVTLDQLFSNDKGAVHFVGDSGRYEAGKISAREKEKLPEDSVAIVQQLLLWLPAGPGVEDTRLYWLLGELYNARNFPGTAKDIFDICVFNRGYTFPEIREHQKIVRAAVPPAQSVAASSAPVSSAAPSPMPAADSRPINTQQIILIGSVAGAVVLGLIYLQLREIRRRRKSVQR